MTARQERQAREKLLGSVAQWGVTWAEKGPSPGEWAKREDRAWRAVLRALSAYRRAIREAK